MWSFQGRWRSVTNPNPTDMASVKVKFRPSTVNGREGTLYYQVIHNRVVRQINTEYKLFVSERDCHSETVVLHHISTVQERNNYLLSIGSRIKWEKERLNKIIHTLSQSGTFVTDDIIMRFHDNRQELSFNAYISQQIARLKRLGKIRTSETYTAALRSFSGFMNDTEALFDQFNADLLAEYEVYLKGRGNTPNTISFYSSILMNSVIDKVICKLKILLILCYIIHLKHCFYHNTINIIPVRLNTTISYLFYVPHRCIRCAFFKQFINVFYNNIQYLSPYTFNLVTIVTTFRKFCNIICHKIPNKYSFFTLNHLIFTKYL